MTNQVEKIGNVSIFPKARIKYPKRVGKLPKLEQLTPKIKMDKAARVDSILVEVLTSAAEILERHHIRCPAVAKEETLYGEALKSLIMKRFELFHPFQQLADLFFIEGMDGKVEFKEAYKEKVKE
jgi:hypothetical protein